MVREVLQKERKIEEKNVSQRKPFRLTAIVCASLNHL